MSKTAINILKILGLVGIGAVAVTQGP